LRLGDHGEPTFRPVTTTTPRFCLVELQGRHNCRSRLPLVHWTRHSEDSCTPRCSPLLESRRCQAVQEFLDGWRINSYDQGHVFCCKFFFQDCSPICPLSGRDRLGIRRRSPYEVCQPNTGLENRSLKESLVRARRHEPGPDKFHDLPARSSPPESSDQRQRSSVKD
jgi:hypothetical protein